MHHTGNECLGISLEYTRLEVSMYTVGNCAVRYRGYFSSWYRSTPWIYEVKNRGFFFVSTRVYAIRIFSSQIPGSLIKTWHGRFSECICREIVLRSIGVFVVKYGGLRSKTVTELPRNLLSWNNVVLHKDVCGQIQRASIKICHGNFSEFIHIEKRMCSKRIYRANYRGFYLKSVTTGLQNIFVLK